MSKKEMDKITASTGVTFATTSNDVGVVVSYNLFGEGATGNSVLLPDDAIAINPMNWTATATEAEILAATKSSDTPKVLLGVVAQRYPRF